MAHASRRRKASSTQEQTSRISQDKAQADLSSYQANHLAEAKYMVEQASFADAMKRVKETYSGGHHSFNDIMFSIMGLHSWKNKGYASGGSPLGNFERAAAIFKLYPNIDFGTPVGAAIGYVMKHIDRVLWDMHRGSTPSDESCRDIIVYFGIISCMIQDSMGSQKQATGEPYGR
jgi:hypothetical protein